VSGSKLGTGAVRRRAQLAKHRPDLRTERLRGLVGTRLGRLDSGEFDGWSWPWPGLSGSAKLGGLRGPAPDFMLSAVGAGVVVVQARVVDAPVMSLLEEFNDTETARHMDAERAMLHALQGHCNSPIAGRCLTLPDGNWRCVDVFNRDGSLFVESCETGDPNDAATLGFIVAADLLKQGARKLITATQK